MTAARAIFRVAAILYLLLGVASLGGVIYALATERTTAAPALAAAAVLTVPCLAAFGLFTRSPDKVRSSLRWLMLLLGAHVGLNFVFSWPFGALLSVPLALSLFGAFCYDRQAGAADATP